MNAWSILTVAAVCAAGALAFLKVVADELSGVADQLASFEARERKAFRRRRQEAAERPAEPAPEVVARSAA